LGEFINHWWWARIFADDDLRAHYFALQDAFGLQSQVESYRTEINDLWNLSAALDSKKSYLNSSRLNTIVLVAAIIGVIPGWVSILFSQSQVVASLLSATVFIVAFATWKLINRSRRSTQYRF
jgi:hypothetical protein